MSHRPESNPRALLLVASMIAFGVSMSAQAPELIVPECLAAKYTAAADAPSMVTVAGQVEPGERLIVTGRTLDGRKPIAGVSLYVFHTDIRGRYATDISDLNAAVLNPRLHGSLRTDSKGQYQYQTIRPGGYDNGPAHVHYVVKFLRTDCRLRCGFPTRSLLGW